MLNSRWTRCAPRASGTQIFLCSLQKMKVPRILRQRSTRKHRKGPQPGQQPAGLLEACWAGLWDWERWRLRGSVPWLLQVRLMAARKDAGGAWGLARTPEACIGGGLLQTKASQKNG